jgi:hypothetical protein
MDTKSQGVYQPGEQISWLVQPSGGSGTYSYTITDGFGNVLTSGHVAFGAHVTYTPTNVGYYQLNLTGTGTIPTLTAAVIPLPNVWGVDATPYGLGQDQYASTWDNRYGFGHQRRTGYNVVTGLHDTLPFGTTQLAAFKSAYTAKINQVLTEGQTSYFDTTQGLTVSDAGRIEFWNEPENEISLPYTMMNGDLTQYAHEFVPAMAAGYAGIKASNKPGTQFLFQNLFLNTADAFFTAGGGACCDGVVWHPYNWGTCGPASPEKCSWFRGTWQEQGSTLLDYAAMRAHSGGKPVGVSEFGWASTAEPGFSNQAYWVVREALLLQAQGFGWIMPYKIADVPFWPEWEGLNFGDGSANPIAPKKAMVSFATLTQTIANLPYAGRLSSGSNAWALLVFGNSTRSVLVFWAAVLAGSPTLSTTSLPSGVTETDLYGNTRVLSSGTYSRVAGYAPVYLTFNSSPALVAAAFGRSLITGPATGLFPAYTADY